MRQQSDWLKELAKEGKYADEKAVPLAMRGFEWRMQVAHEGDLTGYVLTGRVSVRPGAPPEASMDVLGPVLFEGSTLWEVSLSGTQTSELPTSEDNKPVYYFPFLLTLIPPDGEVYPLIGGEIRLLGAI